MAEKNSGKQRQSSASLDARRAELGEKLARTQARIRREAPVAGVRDYGQSSLAMGFRLSADFLSAIIVGGVLGWAIDRFFGCSPWGLAVLLLFGFAAGVVNILRSLGQRRPGG